MERTAPLTFRITVVGLVVFAAVPMVIAILDWTYSVDDVWRLLGIVIGVALWLVGALVAADTWTHGRQDGLVHAAMCIVCGIATGLLYHNGVLVPSQGLALIISAAAAYCMWHYEDIRA